MEIVEFFQSGGLVTALAVFVLVLIALLAAEYIILGIIARRLARGREEVVAAFTDIQKSIRLATLAFIAFAVALTTIDISDRMESVMRIVTIVVLTVQIIQTATIIIRFILIKKYAEGKDATTLSAVTLVAGMVGILLWIVGALFVLSNLGVEVTSLIAGLGIGGIAIALALQGVLGDLFASIAIYFDRPFEVGDFIQFGDKMGTVKHIGVKTTRLELLSGEEFVVTNKELSNGQVQNYSELVERRIATTVSVLSETPAETLERIPDMLRGVIEGTEKVRFDRAHLSDLSDAAPEFEFIYYVEDPEYNTYMDVQQEIYLGILRVFEKEGIEMPYPTQTVYLKK